MMRSGKSVEKTNGTKIEEYAKLAGVFEQVLKWRDFRSVTACLRVASMLEYNSLENDLDSGVF